MKFILARTGATLVDLQALAHARMSTINYPQLFLFMLIGFALSMVSMDVYAQAAGGGGMPWERAICTVAVSLSGTTAKAIAVIAVVVCGLLLAFGEMNGIFKTFLGLLMGVSMALMAVSWVDAIDPGTAFCA